VLEIHHSIQGICCGAHLNCLAALPPSLWSKAKFPSVFSNKCTWLFAFLSKSALF
jgi:hypothetical protein